MLHQTQCVLFALMDEVQIDSRYKAIPIAFAVADPQLVLIAEDIVDGQRETLGETQAAAVDEFEKDAVTAQTDVGEQVANLFAGEHGGKLIVVFGPDLREHAPIVVTEHVDEEDPG